MSHDDEEATFEPPKRASSQLRDVLVRSDIHGLPDVYHYYEQRRGCLLALWLSIIFTASVVLLWQVAQTLRDFKENPILTSFACRSITDASFSV